MAIAGVKPAAFATSELGSMEDAITSITNNRMEPISLPSGTGLFTDEQVREILERYDQWIQYVGNDDVDGFMEGESDE